MLLHGCFNIGISWPQTQYLKMFLKFSRGAELQPPRASRTLSFPQICRFCVSSFNANEEERGGSRRRVGVWPWAAWGHGTMRSAYSGCFTMTKHTTINPFLLNFMVHVLQGVKAKVPFPQFLLNHGGDNPNYSLVVELLGTSKNRRFMRHSIKAERLSKLQSTTHVAHAWS